MAEKLYVKNGGIWKKEDGKMGGSLEVNGQRVNFSIFENAFKKDNEKAPDYILSFKVEGLPACLMPVQKSAPKQDSISINDVQF